MDFRRDDFKRIARAPAKLNLFLELLGRRDDGVHELETLMVPVRLFDSLTLTRPASDSRPGTIRINLRTCWPIQPAELFEVVPDRDNLAVRALELLRQRSGCELGARLELVKRIPVAAGLGGGSSDAAAALQLANRAWNIHWSRERLRQLAAELGSDVPFFLSGGAAICRGRGEQIEPLAAVRPFHFVIVKPHEGLGTSAVYQAHDALSSSPRRTPPGQLSRLVSAVRSGRWQELARELHNGLQTAAASLSPWVERLRAIFDRLDCVGHQLSGSGSAYFGVCRHAQHARRLANILRSRQLGLVYATCSCQ